MSIASTTRTGSRSLVAGRSNGRRVKNTLATVAMWGAFLIALVPLAWILWTVLSKGLSTAAPVDLVAARPVAGRSPRVRLAARRGTTTPSTAPCSWAWPPP